MSSPLKVLRLLAVFGSCIIGQKIAGPRGKERIVWRRRQCTCPPANPLFKHSFSTIPGTELALMQGSLGRHLTMLVPELSAIPSRPIAIASFTGRYHILSTLMEINDNLTVDEPYCVCHQKVIDRWVVGDQISSETPLLVVLLSLSSVSHRLAADSLSEPDSSIVSGERFTSFACTIAGGVTFSLSSRFKSCTKGECDLFLFEEPELDLARRCCRGSSSSVLKPALGFIDLVVMLRVLTAFDGMLNPMYAVSTR